MRIWPARVLVAVATLLPAVLVGAIAGYEHWTFAWLAVWAALSVARATGRHRIVPLREHLISDGRSAAVMCGLISLAAVFGLMPLDAARSSLAVVLVAAGSMFVVHGAQPHELKARRTVLVGSQRDIELYVREGLGDGIIAAVTRRFRRPPARHRRLFWHPLCQIWRRSVSWCQRWRRTLCWYSRGSTSLRRRSRAHLDVRRHPGECVRRVPDLLGVGAPAAYVGVAERHCAQLGVPRATTAARFAKGLVDLIGAAVLLAVFG